MDARFNMFDNELATRFAKRFANMNWSIATKRLPAVRKKRPAMR